MAGLSRLHVHVVLWLLLGLLTVSQTEIHRAKTVKAKGAGAKLYPHYNNKQPNPLDGSYEDADIFDSDMESEIHSGHHDSNVWLFSLLSAVLVGLSGIFPLVVIPLEAGASLRSGAAAASLKRMLSFAVGGLLGDVFLHLLPEAWNHVEGDCHKQTTIGLWVIVGILTFLIVEKCFPDNKEDDVTESDIQNNESSSVLQKNTNNNGVLSTGSDKKSQNSQVHKRGKAASKKNERLSAQNGDGFPSSDDMRSNSNSAKCIASDNPNSISQIKVSGWLNLMANVIDNFTHGLAVAASYCTGIRNGILTTIIILLHEIPHEIGDFAILLRSGFDRWKAAKAQLLTASGGMLGALCALMADSAEAAGNSTAWILPFTAGGFIYIALVTVVPDLLKEENPKESFVQICLLCMGILIMATVGYVLDEHALPAQWLT